MTGHDHDDLLPREAAVDRVLAIREEALSRQPVERIPLDRIGGRTAGEAIVAETDLPPHDYATMDGFAFDASAGYPYDLTEIDVYPEDEPPSIESGQAVRIATGAPLPSGANAVLKREESTVEDGRLEGAAIEPGTYVYGRGSNVSAGETLVAANERLGPKDAILLGDVGVEQVPVRTPFSCAVLATGTEIHEGRSKDLDSAMLAGLVRSWGHEATYEGSVPDDYEVVESRIAELADAYDVVLTTGGTSVGKKDYVIRALSELGDVDFHRAAVRPGKPIAAARLADYDATAFAIPGKPVGAHVITTLVARPFFTGDASLPTVDATLARDVGLGPAGFDYAVPVNLDGGGDDEGDGPDAIPEAMPLGHVDSPLKVYDETYDPSVLSSSTRASRADGFFITTEDRSAGETVEVVPYPVVE